MEATGQIDLGSAQKLAKEAKAAASHGQKSFRLIANALAPVVSMDSFVAKPSSSDEPDPHALEKKPVLVFCCDEERKQVYFAERPLRTAHLQVLDFTSDRKLNVEQQAGWANKSWTVVIGQIFESLTSPQTLERVKLLERPVHDESGHSLQDAERFLTLCLEVASQRAWSMASHSETQPHLWLGICDPDKDLAGNCKTKIQKDAEVVQGAFQAAANSIGDVIEYERTQTLPDVDDVKPASNHADFKSVSAMVVLRVAHVHNFANAGGFWVTRLMDAPNIYLEKITGTYFVSFGVHGDAGMSWEVTPFGDAFFSLTPLSEIGNKGSARRLQFFCTRNLWHPGLTDNEEDYAGVPTRVCLPWEVPSDSEGRGIVLRRTGEDESLFRFWARFGRRAENDKLVGLLKMVSLATGDERKKLVLKWFPDKVTSRGEAGQSKKVFSASYLGAVLGQLEGEEDAREFEALKTQIEEEKRIEFIVSRVGWSRSKASHFTPKAVKALRPPDTVLTWQSASYSFQGYFPIPEALRAGASAKGKAKAEPKGKAKARAKRVQTHWARSRNYKTKRSKLEALTWIVDWLWRTHGKHGGDVTNKPTREQIEAALAEGSKPDAEIDEADDEIPDKKTTESSRKRKASESNHEGSEEVKKSKGSDSSSSTSTSSSSEKDTKGAFSVEDKKESLKASSSSAPKGSGRGRGRTSGAGRGPKLLDTSGVKPHIRPEVYAASVARRK
eukprot:s13_g24.t1